MVPYGTPDETGPHSEKQPLANLILCELFDKKSIIQFTMLQGISRLHNLLIKILWSMKSKKGVGLTQRTTNEKCTKKSVITFHFFRVSFQVSLLADPCTMKPCMFQKPPALISLISIVSWMILGEAAGQCNFRGSDYGKMLTGHTYETF